MTPEPMAGAWQAAAVAAGAALGALARWRLSAMLAPSLQVFPLGTLAVNALGGFCVGVAMVLLVRGSTGHLFWVTGLLGGFTTFSAFSAESLALLQRQAWGAAAAHTVAHVLSALVFAWLGSVAAGAWWGPASEAV
jgi:fluoride exporter